nr:hypothetical protein CFP56_01489 [Quercus suber]
MMKNMRKELDEVKNAMKGKIIINLDGMIKKIDSPFTASVLECPLPPKFHLSQLEVYYGTKDPLDHIEAYKTILNLQQILDKLSNSFVRHFIGGYRHKRPTSYLLTVKQQEGETLREYVKRFNQAVLEIDKADDQMIMTKFQVGLNNPDLVFSLGKTPLISMTDLLFKAQKYMNGE